jgi:hypothetical protein
MSRYIKKKKLDPLDSYVPLVIEAQSQLQQLPALFGELLHYCLVSLLGEQLQPHSTTAATYELCTPPAAA